MKFENLHIKLLYLILVVFSLQTAEVNALSSDLLIELENKEFIEDSIEIEFESLLIDSDGGNNAIISAITLISRSPLVISTLIAYKDSRSQHNKLHLFILFCCLKLDC